MSNCTFEFFDPIANEHKKLQGDFALKAYLFKGGAEALLGDKVAGELGIPVLGLSQSIQSTQESNTDTGKRRAKAGGEYGANARLIVIDKPANGESVSEHIQFSKSTPSTNTHTKATLTNALRTVMDREYGQGWFSRLLSTGKFKVVSRDEANQVAGDGKLFSVAWWKGEYARKADDAKTLLNSIDIDSFFDKKSADDKKEAIEKELPNWGEVLSRPAQSLEYDEERLSKYLENSIKEDQVRFVDFNVPISSVNRLVVKRKEILNWKTGEPEGFSFNITAYNSLEKNAIGDSKSDYIFKGDIKSVINHFSKDEQEELLGLLEEKDSTDFEINREFKLARINNLIASSSIEDAHKFFGTNSIKDLSNKLNDSGVTWYGFDKDEYDYGKNLATDYDGDFYGVKNKQESANEAANNINAYKKAKEIKISIDKIEDELKNYRLIADIKNSISTKNYESVRRSLTQLRGNLFATNIDYIDKALMSVNDILSDEKTEKEFQEYINKQEAEKRDALNKLNRERFSLYKKSESNYREYLQGVFEEMLSPIQKQEIERESIAQEKLRRKKINTRLAKADSIAKFWNSAMQEQGMFMFGNAPEGLTDIDKVIDAVNNTPYVVDSSKSGNTITLTIDGVSGSFVIHDANTKEPYISSINAPSVAGKDLGSLLYQIAYSWANNNNKTIVGDPSGLTTVNHLRRAFQMLSSGMRYGSLRHVYPSDNQISDGLKWSGKSADNISNLIDYISNKVFDSAPNLKDITYNLQNGKFYKEEKEIDNFELSRVARESNDARSHGVGLATAKMAIVTRALREEISRNAQQDGRGMEDSMAKLLGLELAKNPSNKAILKSDKDGNIQAFYNPADDTTYFIAENIDKNKDLLGLASHEIGVHALQLGKNDAEFYSIMEQMLKIANISKPAKQALATALESFGITKVPEQNKPELVKDNNGKVIASVTREQVLHELGGYIVEHHPKLGIVQKFIAWFKSKLRALGKSLPRVEQLKWVRWASQLNEKDLVFMASGALKSAPDSLVFDSVGRGGEAVKLSEGSEDLNETILNVIEAAEKRGLGHFGIRVITKYKDSKRNYSIGDEIENSRVWNDNESSDEELDGVSTIRIDYDGFEVENIDKSLKKLNPYLSSHKEQVVLVGGTASYEGNDRDERVIENGEVLYIFDRPDNLKYSKSPSLQSKITDTIDNEWLNIVNEMKRQGVIEIRC